MESFAGSKIASFTTDKSDVRKSEHDLELIGFDKFQKIVYGFRLNERENYLHYDADREQEPEKNGVKLHLKMLHITASESDETSIAEISLRYPQSYEITLSVVTNIFNETFGIFHLIDGKKLKFYLFFINTGTLTSYNLSVDTCNWLKEAIHGHLPTFYYSDSTGWILETFCNKTVKFYRMLLNEEHKTGYFEYFTTLSSPSPSYPVTVVTNDVIMLVYRENEKPIYIFQFEDKSWTERATFVPPETKLVVSHPSDLNSLYRWHVDSNTLYRFDSNTFAWTEVITKLEVDNMFWCRGKNVATSDMLFIKNRSYELEDLGVHDEEDENVSESDDSDKSMMSHRSGEDCIKVTTFEAYTTKVMSLKDMCMMTLIRSDRTFRVDDFPHTVIREYFGPSWTLKGETVCAGYIIEFHK